MRKFLSIALVILSQTFFIANSYSSEIPKTKLLIVGFNSENPALNSDSREVFTLIKQNLETTGLFDVITEEKIKSYKGIENNAPGSLLITQTNIAPNFDNYKKERIDEIAVAELLYNESGKLEIRMVLWDIFDEKRLFGKKYSSDKDGYKKMSELIADEIYKTTTGEKIGHFHSKIAYVGLSGSIKDRIRKVYVMDYDGTNRIQLTSGRDLTLTPTFSKKHGEVFYLRYFMNRPQIFSVNATDLKTKKIGEFSGTTFAPAVNPKNPELLLLSAIIDGNCDIYEMDISKNTATRLTRSPAIDTTPSYSPDGKQIIFSSDRGGKQDIYLIDRDTLQTKKISTGAGSYSKPVWSPDGTLIAFTKFSAGTFSISVMAPDGSNERSLVKAYLAEGAKWSPNGRYLVYSKQKGAYGVDSIPRLFVIDVVTGLEYELPTPPNEGAVDPDWSRDWKE